MKDDSKNCDFSKNCEKLEKSKCKRRVKDSTKNCDLSNFCDFSKNCEKLEKSQFFLKLLLSQMLEEVEGWQQKLRFLKERGLL